MSLSRQLADVAAAAAVNQPLERARRGTRPSRLQQAVMAQLAFEEEQGGAEGQGADSMAVNHVAAPPLPNPVHSDMLVSALAARAAVLASKAAAEAAARASAAAVPGVPADAPGAPAAGPAAVAAQSRLEPFLRALESCAHELSPHICLMKPVIDSVSDKIVAECAIVWGSKHAVLAQYSLFKPTESPVPPQALAKFGQGVVLALRDKPVESNAAFGAAVGLLPRSIDQKKQVDTFFFEHTAFSQAVSSAVARNADNLDAIKQKMPANLEWLRSPSGVLTRPR